jgi:hypothetical protein
MKRVSKPRLIRVPIAATVEFNPESFDAQHAMVLERLGAQDGQLKRILVQTSETNGRVTVLEHKLEGRWKYLTGGAAGITGCAIVIWELFRLFFAH